ncbi:lactate 2-monooxygenase [Halopiger aswanensis]|uniref:Isopentenyl diphosphate isomerase/L-lactate dehydrogenase-like FMN-dependent dehydrogenase n=1 Tax=Halopiger aswanensis TaxID=148449 RepID=A0A419WDL7_9EURY|nr:lactate 2-monooxygenase [Halopiger aswanensis]RKD93406.1 isopentenyl diphosphate isomerase/L-lactate dehydrogenase-like FMN-dependent dehydrogenase [Halopiger aswanensis]
MADDPSYGRERLVDVYTEGMLADRRPTVPPRFEDLEAAAREALEPAAYAYVAGSAGAERTDRENQEAFSRWRIVPRMLRDVDERDCSVELFGERYPAPVALAPIGVQSILHEDAELGSARAAADLGLPFVQSSAATEPLEDVAAAADGPAWFQLYWSSNRELTRSFVERAEAAGYEALVVTVDTPVISWRERDVEHGYLPFLDGEGVGNYFTDPVFEELLGAPPEENRDAAVMQFVDVFGDASLTWADLEWLRGVTDLPILVKGIVHPEDAALAVDAGADGVIVSNHGGRQVDNALPAIEALPQVVDRLADEGYGDVPVLFDSGIRRGADAVVALALGAEMVLLGRPYVYGLAVDGEDGVREVCRNFLADLDLTMGLSGQASVDDLDRSLLVER